MNESVLLGCIAVALFLLCSCFMLGIFCHKNIKQEKINNVKKCISAYREPDLTDVVLYHGTTCPCHKTNCIYHGNCNACIEKHRSKNKPTRCERLKAKIDKKR